LRHAQDIVVYLVELENYHSGVKDAAGKQAWMEAPEYQPSRRLAEKIIGTSDWGELLVALNLVVGPLAQQVAMSELVRHNAPMNGDPVAAHIVMTAERDRRRNLAAAQALVRMVTAPGLAEADSNRAVIQEWLAQWNALAKAACEALAPVFKRVPQCAVTYEAAMAGAIAQQAAALSEVGL
jgi:methane monooxygenase component A beta chain/propane monooxygenase small subunit